MPNDFVKLVNPKLAVPKRRSGTNAWLGIIIRIKLGLNNIISISIDP
jgi:hypothetical protein